MKSPFSLLALALALAFAPFADAADQLVIVPARGLTPEVAKTILSELVQAATNRLAPATRISVVDPVALDLVAGLTVPTGTRTQREHNPAFARQVGALRAALLAPRAPAQAWQVLALRLPETLRFLSEQVVPAGEKATVLFIGSPLYRGFEGTTDFVRGTVPGDGWLNAPSEDSVFATTGLNLKGWTLHIATVTPVWAESDWQAAEVRRFWCAYVNAGDGSLATFAPVALAWERVREGATAPLPFRATDRETRALVWRKRTFVRGQEIETTVKSNDITEVQPAPAAVALPVAPTPEPAPAPTQAQQLTKLEQRAAALPVVGPERMGLGLIWETDQAFSKSTDLDSWVLVRGETECNYNKLLSGPVTQPHVRLHKDIRQARGLAANREPQAFEFVEINRPVLPDDVQLWVNVYENKGQRPIRALLQMEYRGRHYRQEIEFPGISGDRADGSNRRSDSECWRRIDLVKLAAQAPTN